MIKKFSQLLKGSVLVKSSLIVLIGSVFSNLASYLYHLSMGRLLGPSNYGVLESLISILYFLGIPIGILNLVVVKFVSQENSDKEKISFFVKKVSRSAFRYGLLVLLLFLLAFPFLRNLVKINSFILFLGLGISWYLGIFSSVFSSVLQGILKFFEYSVYTIFLNWSKLIFAVVLVLLGLKVEGAILGVVLSTLATLLFGYFLLKKFIPVGLSGNINMKDSFVNVGSYAGAVFFSNLSLMSFFTVDIILARYFLSPIAAGQYASLSVLGKIIFFASSPIVSVMFPTISERKANGGNYQKLLWFSFFLVLAISSFISLIYFLFPSLMVKTLFGIGYLEAASNLGLFAIFISLYSLCSLLMYFFLSINKTKIIYLGVVFAVLQIVLINFYHQNIQQIVLMNIIVLSFFLTGLLVYYFNPFKKPANFNK